MVQPRAGPGDARCPLRALRQAGDPVPHRRRRLPRARALPDDPRADAADRGRPDQGVHRRQHQPRRLARPRRAAEAQDCAAGGVRSVPRGRAAAVRAPRLRRDRAEVRRRGRFVGRVQCGERGQQAPRLVRSGDHLVGHLRSDAAPRQLPRRRLLLQPPARLPAEPRPVAAARRPAPGAVRARGGAGALGQPGQQLPDGARPRRSGDLEPGGAVGPRRRPRLAHLADHAPHLPRRAGVSALRSSLVASGGLSVALALACAGTAPTDADVRAQFGAHRGALR